MLGYLVPSCLRITELLSFFRACPLQQGLCFPQFSACGDRFHFLSIPKGALVRTIQVSQAAFRKANDIHVKSGANWNSANIYVCFYLIQFTWTGHVKGKKKGGTLLLESVEMLCAESQGSTQPKADLQSCWTALCTEHLQGCVSSS